MRVLTEGLQFPEGPVELADGSVAVVELRGSRVTRVLADGQKVLLAHTGGGPNGMAWGPKNKLFICNNGGSKFPPGSVHSVGPADDYVGGSIQVLDPETGIVTTLYTECEGRQLSSPNDLVFDSEGGFYFTDAGKNHGRSRTTGSLYYALADGSCIREVAHPVTTPNGIGLSPDGRELYFSETETGRVWAFHIDSPGTLTKHPFPCPPEASYVTAAHGARLILGFGGYVRADSFAVDSEGNLCIGTLGTSMLKVISPQGDLLRELVLPDSNVTNVCFGGPALRTAYITVSLSTNGKLVAVDWPVPGLRLNYAPQVMA